MSFLPPPPRAADMTKLFRSRDRLDRYDGIVDRTDGNFRTSEKKNIRFFWRLSEAQGSQLIPVIPSDVV